LRLWLLILALLAAIPASAAEPEWHAAPEYEVLMRPFGYEPPTIRLTAGRPVKLRFINQGQATFSFSAETFFRTSQIRAGDVAAVTDGHFEVAPGEQRVIALIPAPGRYHAHSSNLIHRMLGMSAEIVVE
jgi:plastocyanin